MTLATRRRLIRLRNHLPPAWLCVVAVTLCLLLERTLR